MTTILNPGKKVKTRKPRMCHGCRRKFPAGAILKCISYADGGSAFSVYSCNVCEEVIATMDPEDFLDGIGEGEVRESDPDFWEEKRKEIEGEDA